VLSLTFWAPPPRPTIERSVSAIALQREGETLLFDCGEGTQRQMMRYGVGFTLADIFFTHFHSDTSPSSRTARTFGPGRTDPLCLWDRAGGAREPGARAGRRAHALSD
jgi:ribonuclease Z